MAVGKIQRTARGFLQFLGMVGTGVPPTLMADDVRATVDLLPFYGTDLLQSQSANGNVAARGDTLTLAVPPGEAWMLVSGQYHMSVGAAGEQVRLAYRLGIKDGGTISVDTMPSVLTAIAASAVLGRGFLFPRPILLTAGNSIVIRVEDINVAAARTANVSCAAYVFPS